MKPRSEIEKKLQRIALDDYKADLTVRQRAQRLYGTWSVENVLDQHDPDWRERPFPADEEARIRQMFEEKQERAGGKRKPHRLMVEFEKDSKR